MIKTLLLCFIHGFKGDEETFFQFPDDLKILVQEKCPGLNVHTAVYPKYETRGDLAACVVTFREWLQEQVTYLEVKAATPSPILDPSVSVILIAHSMGGFVATDTIFSILSNRPQLATNPAQNPIFPHLHGIISFDTPYNGLARSLFAYGAFSQYQNLSSAWNLVSTLGAGGLALASNPTTSTVSRQAGRGGGAGWKRWQALAARTGTAGAIVAGGVGAYYHREEIARGVKGIYDKGKAWEYSYSYPYIKAKDVPKGEIEEKTELKNDSKDSKSESQVSATNQKGWKYSISSALPSTDTLSQSLSYITKESIGSGFTWIASHLKFVGALMKQEQMTERLERLGQVEGIGKKNFYTSLGENGYWSGGYFFPRRTFCAVPVEKEKEKGMWEEIVNGKAENEVVAHCGMFRPEKNSGYDGMLNRAGELVGEWIGADMGEVKDGYVVDERQRARSISEERILDDDGRMKGDVVRDIMNQNGDQNKEEDNFGAEEDERQLKAILECQDLPQPEDGGISDEVLEEALGVPLPADEFDESVQKGGNDTSEKVLKEAREVPLPEDGEEKGLS